MKLFTFLTAIILHLLPIKIFNISNADELKSGPSQLRENEMFVNMKMEEVKLLDPGELLTTFDLSLTWRNNAEMEYTNDPIKFLTFVRGQSEIVKDVFSRQKALNFTSLTGQNMIVWQKKLKTRTPCFLNYKDHPFDKHFCILKLSSSGQILKWVDTISDKQFAVSLESNIGTEFKLQHHEIGTCDYNQANGSCVFIKFLFHRHYSPYLTKTFIPAGLFVLLCWMTFWLGDNINVRISVSLTILLAFAVQTSELMNTLPQTPYTKAIDLWTGTTLSMTLMGICETMFVACLLQKVRTKRRLSEIAASDNHDAEAGGEKKPKMNCSRKRIAVILDNIFKATFLSGYYLYTYLFLNYYGVSLFDFMEAGNLKL